MTDLDALRAELDDFAQPVKKKAMTPREERIVAGFEDIQKFVNEHKRLPEPYEGGEIFERLYAVRLQRLRELKECRDLLEPLDHQGILAAPTETPDELQELDDDALLAELAGIDGTAGLTELRHVRSSAARRQVGEVAERDKCEDFEQFKPLFEQVQRDLEAGVRRTLPFGKDTAVEVGHFFVVSGLVVYVAEKGEEFMGPQGHPDARLRAIYSNGTESNLLMRSLVRALYKDDASRRISDTDLGPLFAGTLEDDDIESGTIYVLRSHSDNPFVTEHRDLIHKIGVTGGKVEARIANAAHDPTYLLADVEVVATYKLAGINRTKMENLFHRIFSPAKLELEIEDRFGRLVKPQEWFLVPLSVIDEAVERIRNGTITEVVYEPQEARLVAK